VAEPSRAVNRRKWFWAIFGPRALTDDDPKDFPERTVSFYSFICQLGVGVKMMGRPREREDDETIRWLDHLFPLMRAKKPMA
jgi:hypothetical protein